MEDRVSDEDFDARYVRTTHQFVPNGRCVERWVPIGLAFEGAGQALFSPSV